MVLVVGLPGSESLTMNIHFCILSMASILFDVLDTFTRILYQ
jgi:hypothetical protein